MRQGTKNYRGLLIKEIVKTFKFLLSIDYWDPEKYSVDSIEKELSNENFYEEGLSVEELEETLQDNFEDIQKSGKEYIINPRFNHLIKENDI